METMQSDTSPCVNYLPLVKMCCQSPTLKERVLIKVRKAPSSVSQFIEFHEMASGNWIRLIDVIEITAADQLAFPATVLGATEMVARKIQALGETSAQ